MATAFISYSRKDADFVRRLYAALEQHGLESWVDWEGIPPADDWLRKVYAAIESADAFVFVMSPDSLSSSICADEVAHAVKHNKRLIPVVVREVNRVTDPDVEIPEPLRRLNWVFFRATDDFGIASETLVAGIRTDLEWVESHTRLLGRAIEWEAARRDESFLLQKNDLVAAEQWLARAPDKNPKPTALQSEYIIASRAAATLRQRRLTLAAIAATILIGIGAIVATVQYVIAEIRREQGLSRQLAAQSVSTMDESPELGLLLGVYAHDVAPTVEASKALLSALDRVRGVRAFLAGEYLPGTLALSADGALMAVGRCLPEGESECKKPVIELWRVADPRRIGTVGVELPVWRLAFSDDATRLAATVCCVDESDSGRARALMFDLAGDSSATDAVRLVKVADRPSDRWRGPTPAELLTNSRAVADGREALEHVRRAAGASEKAFAGTPATYRSGTRVLAEISGANLGAPSQVELWDATSPPRRLARVVLRSPVWGESRVRSDGRLAAAFGCALMASGRICDEGQLVIIDDTGEVPRVATIGYDQSDWIRALAVMPAEPLVLSGGCGKYDYQNCRYGELRVWQVESDAEKPLGYEPVQTFNGAVESIAVSADGKAMGLTSQRGNVSLWRIDGLRGEAGWLASPLEARFASQGSKSPLPFSCGKDVVKNPVLKQARARLQVPAELCSAFAVFVAGINQTAIDDRVVTAASASGTRLALAGCAARKRGTAECEAGRTTVWSIVDRRLAPLATIDTPNEVTTLAFSPDENHLAVASCSGTRAQECEDGKLELVDLAQVEHPRRTLAEGVRLVTAVAIAPGNGAVAYATCARLEDVGAVRECALGAIRLLGLAPSTGVNVALNGHRGEIDFLAFSPDGTLLVSGGSDGKVGLWDPTHGERLGLMAAGHSRPLATIRFASPESFVSSTESEEIEWHATPARWKSAACRIANRRLTDAEHARFLGPRATVRDPCASPPGAQGSVMWRWVQSIVGREG